jgi:glutathione S-transferase
MRAWLSMRELNITFDEHVVDIRRPQRFSNLAKIAEFSPPGAVPVLVDDDVVISDSLAIMEYANELGGGSLLPTDVRLRAHARSLVAWVHSGMSNICSNISFESSFYKTRREMNVTEIAEAAKVCAVWERELVASGGPFLMGELSLADLAFVPVVQRLLSHNVNLTNWPLTEDWASQLMSRPSVIEWMQLAESLPPVFEQIQ